MKPRLTTIVVVIIFLICQFGREYYDRPEKLSFFDPMTCQSKISMDGLTQAAIISTRLLIVKRLANGTGALLITELLVPQVTIISAVLITCSVAHKGFMHYFRSLDEYMKKCNPIELIKKIDELRELRKKNKELQDKEFYIKVQMWNPIYPI